MASKTFSAKDNAEKKKLFTIWLKIIDKHKRGFLVVDTARQYNWNASMNCTIMLKKDEIKAVTTEKGTSRLAKQRTSVLERMEKLLLRKQLAGNHRLRKPSSARRNERFMGLSWSRILELRRMRYQQIHSRPVVAGLIIPRRGLVFITSLVIEKKIQDLQNCRGEENVRSYANERLTLILWANASRDLKI